MGKSLVAILKPFLSNLLSKQAGDVRFNAEAWISVWVSDSDLEFEKAIQELKKSDLPIDQKIANAKEFAKELARRMISDLDTSGLEVDHGTLELDFNADNVDWKALVSGSPMEEEADLNDPLKSLFKIAQQGLELFTQMTEEDWYNLLKDYESDSPLDETKLKKIYDKLVQKAIDDIKKIEPMMLYVEDYNRLKRAFDKFAKERNLTEWREGTSQGEWVSP